MRLMFSANLRFRALFTFVLLSLALTLSVSAQKKSAASKKPTAVKKTTAAKKDARKGKQSTAARTADKKSKTPAKGKRDTTAATRSKSKRDDKKTTASKRETKREAAERRRKERERAAAILAERRRREQAAREARARKLAFERGLRTETIANISNDNVEGEDLAIRRAAVEALGDNAGSVVVMEAQTGKILTVVNQEWALRSSIKPCSTIKLVTGVAALNENVISNDDGSIRDTSMALDLDDALAYSNNKYFQRAGSNIGSRKMVEYARALGLGQPTGINTANETAGKVPDGNENPRIYSHGDDFEVSTIQLAVMVSAITNGGKRVLPRVPRNTMERSNFQTFYRDTVDVPRQNVRRVIPGMIGAAEYGTARRGVDSSLGIAGKTGSCISKGTWVGLFASVAPIESPKYAVAVILRGQGERGRYAAAVAGKIYEALRPGIERTDTNLAQTEFKILPKGTKADTTAVADADDEEDDVADDDGTAAASDDASDVIIVPSAPRQAPADQTNTRKLVTRTGSSKPIFPPVVITYDKDKPENGSDKKKKP